MMVPVNTIEISERGEIVFNLASTALNDDWLRAFMLLEDDKQEEFDRLDTAQMFYEIEEEI